MAMFEIILNNQRLDLLPGQEIVLESESSLFTDTLQADGSELINLAPTPRNLKALGHADVLEIDPQSSEYVCQVRLNGNTYTGVLRIAEVTASSINVYVLYNQAELTCLTKNCRDFNWGVNLGPFNTFQDQWEIVASNIWPDTPFYFPAIQNPVFFDDADTDPANKIEPEYKGVINRHDEINGSPKWTDNFIDGTTGLVNNVNIAVPMIPLLEVFKRAFNADGYQIIGSFVEHPAIKRAFLYNNKTINEPAYFATDRVTATNAPGYVTGYNSQKLNFITTTNNQVFNVVNDEYIVPSTGIFRFQITLGIGNINPGQPGVIQVFKQNSLLTEVAITGGAIANGLYELDFKLQFGLADVGQTLYFAIDGAFYPTGTSNITNLKLEVTRQYNKALTAPVAIANLTEHAPDVLFSELLNQTVKAFNLEVNVNKEERFVKLDFKKDKITIINPKNLNTAAGALTQEWPEVTDYVFKWGNKDGDEVVDKSVLRQGYLSKENGMQVNPLPREGVKADDLSTDLHLLQYREVADGSFNGGSTLHIEERGRSTYHNLTETEGALAIGLVNNVYPYRLGANANQDIDLIVQPNLFSILQFHTPWLQWLQKSYRIFKVELLPTHPQVQKLQAGDQITLQNNIFLVQRLTKTYTLNGLKKVVAELRKL